MGQLGVHAGLHREGRQLLPLVSVLSHSNLGNPLTFHSQVVLKDLTVSSFIAELLASDETAFTIRGVQLATILMEKLPDIFRVYFPREVGGDVSCARAF